MDPFGDIFKELFARSRRDQVRNAKALAKELKSDGMTKPEVREMLFASGFDADVIKEAVRHYFPEVK